MSAARIRAELVARLETERFTNPKPRGPRWADPITPEEAAANRAVLADALSGDAVVIAWREAAA